MRRREFIFLFGGVAAWPTAAHAEAPRERPLIAWLSGQSKEGAASGVGAFQEGLRELGYTEG